jgi:hypothetical protein
MKEFTIRMVLRVPTTVYVEIEAPNEKEAKALAKRYPMDKLRRAIEQDAKIMIANLNLSDLKPSCSVTEVHKLEDV